MILDQERDGFQPAKALSEIGPFGGGISEVLGTRDIVLDSSLFELRKSAEPARQRLEAARRAKEQPNDSPHYAAATAAIERHARLGGSAYTTVATAEHLGEARQMEADARQFDAPIAPELQTQPTEPVLSDTERKAAEALQLIDDIHNSTDEQYALGA